MREVAFETTAEDLVRRQFDVEPVAYKAGRYGFGPHTMAILEELGYTIDTSVMPVTDFSEFEGPDYAAYSAWPFWFGNTRRLLEVPATRGLVGISDALSGVHFARIDSPRLRRYHVPGLLARLGILERITDEFNRVTWQPQMEGGKAARELPGIVDEVITLSLFTAEGDSFRHDPERGQVRRLVCQSGNPFGLPAKDRSGRLDLTEPPDLGAFLRKINIGSSSKG